MSKYYLPQSFLIPYQSIDDEHRHLIALLNQMTSQAELPASQDIRAMADQFLVEINTHFREEEALMHAVNYPRAEEHAAHHVACLQTITGILQATLDQGLLQLTALDQVFSILIDVVVKTDLYFEEFLIGTGRLPDRAKPA